MIKTLMIIFSLMLMPFSSFALTPKECSLKCKGRFFSQKGIGIIETVLSNHAKMNKEVIDSILGTSTGDQKLAIGCLAICDVKDIRDSICLVLRKNDPEFIKKVSALFAYNKKAKDFSQEHELSCRKLAPGDAELISKNYATIRRLLSAKSD